MKISFVIFDGYTALDFIGGYEVLARLPGAEAEFAAVNTGLIAADTRRLGIAAYQKLAELEKTDILYVPGGPGVNAALENDTIIKSIRRLHKTAKWTVGICNGVELLGKAGILQGRTVTTNFFARSKVATYGAKVTTDRYVADGNLITGAGVSASIDTAFMLAREIAGEKAAQVLQLGIEYYPAPPFPDHLSADEAPDFAKQAVIAYEQSEPERIKQHTELPF